MATKEMLPSSGVMHVSSGVKGCKDGSGVLLAPFEVLIESKWFETSDTTLSWKISEVIGVVRKSYPRSWDAEIRSVERGTVRSVSCWPM